MNLLTPLAKACAILAGVLLTFITLMTCVSLIGRNTIGQTLVGDFELTGVAAGAAISLFLPWCQIRRGHIIVDFFTAKASEGTRNGLDRIGLLCTALLFGVLAWRTGIGGWDAWETKSGTMMLGFPEWLVYLVMTPALALTTVIALWQAAIGHTASLEHPA
jgi:TRAP-type C4-dicarboxylate transport system permease small subunit